MQQFAPSPRVCMLEGWRMPCDEPLEIGKIVNTHGLKGEVKVTPWCDDSRVFYPLTVCRRKTIG